MSDVDSFIEHFGKKGMKWGVRRTNPGAMTGSKHKAVKKSRQASTKGFSKDAKAAHVIRNKAKKSPAKVKSLSNQEINTFLNRVNLESRFHQATPSNRQKALRTVKNILGIGSTMNDVANFSNSKSGQAIKQGISKAKPKKSTSG